VRELWALGGTVLIWGLSLRLIISVLVVGGLVGLVVRFMVSQKRQRRIARAVRVVTGWDSKRPPE
jgi:hypothetical protein